MNARGLLWPVCAPIAIAIFGSCTSSTPTPGTVTPCDGAHVDLNGEPGDGCEYACTKTSDADPFDNNLVDDNCDGSDGEVSRCVFVSSDGLDLQGSGTRSSPVKTLDYAITTAAAEGKVVCLGAGVYAGTLKVTSGVSVYGGFDTQNAVFKFRRAAGAVSEIQSEGIGVLAETITAATEIGWLKITVTAPAAAGSSVYGVRLVSGTASLKLTSLEVQVASGVAGVDGPAGDKATDGNPGREPTVLVLPFDAGGGGGNVGASSTITKCGGAEIELTRGGAGGNGAPGQSTVTGDDGDPGGGGATKGSGGQKSTVCPGAAGGKGYPGIKGDDGDDGPGSTGGTFSIDGQFVPGDGSNGNTGAAGGGGGGGGGGGSVPGSTNCEGFGGSSGGSGGCAGGTGKGGKGGGASIGITNASGILIVEGGKFTIGTGGKGGDGGAGTVGGKGGSGATGKAGPAGASGGNGGAGGAGGSSGGGGGGAGGNAACIAIHDTTRLTVPTQPQCTLSAQAQGGSGASPATGGAKGKTTAVATY